jgi:hypothetical protein
MSMAADAAAAAHQSTASSAVQHQAYPQWLTLQALQSRLQPAKLVRILVPKLLESPAALLA